MSQARYTGLTLLTLVTLTLCAQDGGRVAESLWHNQGGTRLNVDAAAPNGTGNGSDFSWSTVRNLP